MWVSLAHILGMLNERQSGKSLIYIRNKSGPTIVPCGTPHLTVVKSERQPLTGLRCVRFVKYDLNQSSVSPWIPHRFILVISHNQQCLMPFLSRETQQHWRSYFIWILKQRIQNISKQNGTRWCFSVVNKPSEQEQTSAKVNCKIRIRLLWEKKIITCLG